MSTPNEETSKPQPTPEGLAMKDQKDQTSDRPICDRDRDEGERRHKANAPETSIVPPVFPSVDRERNSALAMPCSPFVLPWSKAPAPENQPAMSQRQLLKRPSTDDVAPSNRIPPQPYQTFPNPTGTVTALPSAPESTVTPAQREPVPSVRYPFALPPHSQWSSQYAMGPLPGIPYFPNATNGVFAGSAGSAALAAVPQPWDSHGDLPQMLHSMFPMYPGLVGPQHSMSLQEARLVIELDHYKNRLCASQREIDILKRDRESRLTDKLEWISKTVEPEIERSRTEIAKLKKEKEELHEEYRQLLITSAANQDLVDIFSRASRMFKWPGGLLNGKESDEGTSVNASSDSNEATLKKPKEEIP